MPIVYGLVHTLEQEEIRYVGMSGFDDVHRRFSSHISRMRNGHDLPVYDWMRKYPNDVIPIVLDTNVSLEYALEKEKELIHLYKEQGMRLLNCTSGGNYPADLSEESRMKLVRSSTGRKHTEETKAKMSAAKKGRPGKKGIIRSEEWKRRISESHKGKALTEEHKRKISESSGGWHHTEETKRLIGAVHKNKIVSEETRKKLSEAHKGKTPSNKGVPMALEQRAKLSKARMGREPWNKGKGKKHE